MDTFLQCERRLHDINIDELWYLLCEIKALEYLQQLLVKTQTVMQYAAHQVIALQLYISAVCGFLQLIQDKILQPVRQVAVSVQRRSFQLFDIYLTVAVKAAVCCEIKASVRCGLVLLDAEYGLGCQTRAYLIPVFVLISVADAAYLGEDVRHAYEIAVYRKACAEFGFMLPQYTDLLKCGLKCYRLRIGELEVAEYSRVAVVQHGIQLALCGVCYCSHGHLDGLVGIFSALL